MGRSGLALEWCLVTCFWTITGEEQQFFSDSILGIALSEALGSSFYGCLPHPLHNVTLHGVTQQSLLLGTMTVQLLQGANLYY